MHMLGTLEFWLWAWFFILNIAALWNSWVWVKQKFELWRHRRLQAMLRLSPKQLNAKIKTLEQAIAGAEDELLKTQNEREHYKQLYNEYREEVRRLCKRNMFMANEISCDEDKQTRALIPVRPSRWFHGS